MRRCCFWRLLGQTLQSHSLKEFFNRPRLLIRHCPVVQLIKSWEYILGLWGIAETVGSDQILSENFRSQYYFHDVSWKSTIKNLFFSLNLTFKTIFLWKLLPFPSAFWDTSRPLRELKFFRQITPHHMCS